MSAPLRCLIETHSCGDYYYVKCSFDSVLLLKIKRDLKIAIFDKIRMKLAR